MANELSNNLSASTNHKGFASIRASKTFSNIFEIDEGDNNICVGNTNGNLEHKKLYPQTFLKSAIHRSRVKQQRYTPPERTFDQLYNKNADIPTGPEFDDLNADESMLEVTGGDGSTPVIRTFDGLIRPLQKNLKEKGYNVPTLIQKYVIPIVALKKGHDLIAQALTGTGKTEAFLLPIMHLLERKKQKCQSTENSVITPKAIIVAPTRELVQQLGDMAKAFSRGLMINTICTYGEIPVYETISQMKSSEGCEILVITHGRLKQFIEEKKIQLTNLKFFVMDEADKFFKDQKIYDDILGLQKAILEQTQYTLRTLMFSATFDSYIEGHAQTMLRPGYFRITTSSEIVMSPSVKQEFIIANTIHEKLQTLFTILNKDKMQKNVCKDENGVTWKRLNKKVVIFCNSRRRTNWLALKLALRGWKALPTNSGRSQKQRQNSRDEFESESGFSDLLVSTDVSSRGLNFVGVGLIINFDLPKSFDEYVHRIGRTGRAGNRGRAISFINRENILDLHLMPLLAEHIQKMNDDKLVPKMLCIQCCVNMDIPGKWCICEK